MFREFEGTLAGYVSGQNSQVTKKQAHGYHNDADLPKDDSMPSILANPPFLKKNIVEDDELVFNMSELDL